MLTLNSTKDSFTLRRQRHFVCRCRHEWVRYPFIMATATEKMGIMESSDGVHTAAVMATEKIEFFVLSVAIAVAV